PDGSLRAGPTPQCTAPRAPQCVLPQGMTGAACHRRVQECQARFSKTARIRSGMATDLYSPGDVTRSHEWLDHPPGLTEVSILHPAYKPGEQDWNRRHQAWPITRYVTSTGDLLLLVRSYAGERLLCYGLNPRPALLRHEDGRARSAKEADITQSQTLLLDLD